MSQYYLSYASMCVQTQEEEPIFCPKCGKENKGDASVCIHCAATLGKQETPVPRQSSEGGSWKRFVIGFVIAVVILTLSVVGRSLTDTPPPQVVTNQATGTTANQATLNGDLTRRGETSPAYVSFQWGTSPHSYPNETEAEARGTAGAFSFDLTGLNPNTTYYFRAKAVGYGTRYGCEQRFKTTQLVTNSRAVRLMFEEYPFLGIARMESGCTSDGTMDNLFQISTSGKAAKSLTISNPTGIWALEPLVGYQRSGSFQNISGSTSDVTALESFDDFTPALTLASYDSGAQAVYFSFEDWGYTKQVTMLVRLIQEYSGIDEPDVGLFDGTITQSILILVHGSAGASTELSLVKEPLENWGYPVEVFDYTEYYDLLGSGDRWYLHDQGGGHGDLDLVVDGNMQYSVIIFDPGDGRAYTDVETSNASDMVLTLDDP